MKQRTNLEHTSLLAGQVRVAAGRNVGVEQHRNHLRNEVLQSNILQDLLEDLQMGIVGSGAAQE